MREERREAGVERSYREEGRRNQIESSGGMPPRRLVERKRRNAAVRVQAALRGAWQRRETHSLLRSRDAERRERADARQEARRHRRMDKSAAQIQSRVRARLARGTVTAMRQDRTRAVAEAAEAAAALRTAVAAAQHSTPAAQVLTPGRVASPVVSSAGWGRELSHRPSDHFSSGGELSGSEDGGNPYVVVHSSALGDLVFQNSAVKEVWVELELADGRLLSAHTMRRPVPAAQPGACVEFEGTRFFIDLRDRCGARQRVGEGAMRQGVTYGSGPGCGTRQ